MRPTTPASLLLAFGIALTLAMASGCPAKQEVTVVFEGEEQKPTQTHAGEEELREKFEKHKKDRENQPEPELDPTEPREKFELVWRMGKGKLSSIYNERSEMIAMLRRTKLDDKKEKKLVEAWLTPLTEFGVGREPASMEAAPAELCKLINDIRVPAETLIATGEEQLELVIEEEKQLDAHADAGGTVYQKQWDKIDEQRKRWSAPVRAGKQMLLVVKSLLEEAFVLADLGPRRVQIALRDCLTPIADKPLRLDIAQEQLEKTVKRSRWYRELE